MASSLRLTSVAGMLLLAVIGVSGDSQQTAPPAPPAAQAPARQEKDQDQPPPADQQPPVFRTGINFVRVDVIVSDKNGNPIVDLQPGDFEVTEEDTPQTIEMFKRIELDGGLMPGKGDVPRAIRTDSDEETAAARDDVRLFAIFLDDYHVRATGSLGARQSIARFVETQLGPSDMVGLMYPLEPAGSVRFTRNLDAISRAIQRFLGRKFDYTPKNTIEERYAHYPPETIERIRNQVSLTALQALISRMGSLKEGRKALILVSEGYTYMLPPQMRDRNAQMPGFDNPARGNPMAGTDDPNEFRAMAMADSDMQNDLREVYDAANRNNVAIYAVDPRGLATSEFDIAENIGTSTDRTYLNSTMDTLRVLGEESDGRAIVNRNDLTIAMKQIVRDSSSYYLLGYNSTRAPTDGKFHEIKVRVKRPGVQVRARKGYWALTREDTARALAPPRPGPPKALEAALAAVNQPTRARLIRSWIGLGRGENGNTRVTFLWEPAPKAPGDPVRSADQPARVSLTATGPDGTPYFRGRVPEAIPATAAARSRVTFEVPPGALQLRVAVEASSSDVLDAETREIAVPDLTSLQTALGTPEVFRARTVREIQQLKADPQALPVAGREFSRTDRLFLRIPAYGPGASTPTLTARLLNRAGQAMTDLPVTAAPSPSAVAEVDVPLAGLAPGEYVVEIKAAGDGGEAQELVGFRVTG